MEIKESTDAMMKSIIDVQDYQRDEIRELKIAIDGIRSAMMTSLRFELKDEMNKCILRGYRTPEETEEIEAKFHDYVHSLKGNHGIEAMYNNDFLRLPIKERHSRRTLWSLFTK